MQKIISIIDEYRHQSSNMKQIKVYPDVTNSLINEVTKQFEEFDDYIETPLIFCVDSDNSNRELKWLMLSNAKLYYFLSYFPHKFNALNTIALGDIDNFNIEQNRWTKVFYLKINDKVIGSLEFRDKSECHILTELINRILSNIDAVPIAKIDNDYLHPKLCGNDELFGIALNYFNEVNPGGRLWAFKSFYYDGFIPKDKLETAFSEYAAYDAQTEKPIIYVDNSWAGKLTTINSSGIVITNKFLYYKLNETIDLEKFSVGKIPLESIKSFAIKSGFSGKIHINGKLKFYITPFNCWDRREARVLAKLMQIFIQHFRILGSGEI